MTKIFLVPGGDFDNVQSKIELQTRLGNYIDNYQGFTTLLSERKSFEKLEKDSIKSGVSFKGNPTPLYNCHGMTFASSRTCIINDDEIDKIIREDQFEQIYDISNNLIIGDIAIYKGKSDDTYIHSGIVIDICKDLFNQIFVLSKWARFKVAIHEVNLYPKDTGDYYLTYYRNTNYQTGASDITND